MRPLRIYPAGPITAPDVFGILRNLDAGLDATAELLDSGFAPFPVFCDFMACMRTRQLNVEGIKRLSLAWLPYADAVLMLQGWRKSPGAIAERELALELGIPVFEDMGALSEWRRTCSATDEVLARSDD